ncbi:cytochrome P450 2B4-like [Littorina saxatilis]
MEPLTIGLLLSVVSVVLYMLVSNKHAPYRLPPGPRGVHSLRVLLDAMLSGKLHLEAENWAKQYGEVVLCKVPGRNIVFLNSSRAIREVYSSKDREHVTNDRPHTFSGWFTMHRYSDVILGSPTDPRWTKLRKLFHSSIRFYGDGVERFESTVQIELRRLTERVLATETVTSPSEHAQSRGGIVERELNMSDLTSYSLLCVLSVLLTGECPEPDADVVQRIKKFDRDVNILFNPSTDGMMTALPFLRHLPGYYRNVCRNVERSRADLMDTLFTEAKQTRQPGQPRGIVDVLLEEQDKAQGDWLTDTHIQCVIMDTVITAYLTSRETLLDLFLYLQHLPEVTRKIQAEVDHSIGDRMPRIEDKSNLPYTEAVILEVLRHSSFIPLGVPHECREAIVYNEMTIPKGSLLFANTWVCHQDPNAFEDPTDFRPERFLDDSGRLILATNPLRQNLLSFGAGKRACPGENFARTRVFLYVTTLLQKFDILPPVKHELLPLQRDSWDSGAMLHLKPYHCVLRNRV